MKVQKLGPYKDLRVKFSHYSSTQPYVVLRTQGRSDQLRTAQAWHGHGSGSHTHGSGLKTEMELSEEKIRV